MESGGLGAGLAPGSRRRPGQGRIQGGGLPPSGCDGCRRSPGIEVLGELPLPGLRRSGHRAQVGVAPCRCLLGRGLGRSAGCRSELGAWVAALTPRGSAGDGKLPGPRGLVSGMMVRLSVRCGELARARLGARHRPRPRTNGLEPGCGPSTTRAVGSTSAGWSPACGRIASSRAAGTRRGRRALRSRSGPRGGWRSQIQGSHRPWYEAWRRGLPRPWRPAIGRPRQPTSAT
jgi:hypothetical protein